MEYSRDPIRSWYASPVSLYHCCTAMIINPISTKKLDRTKFWGWAKPQLALLGLSLEKIFAIKFRHSSIVQLFRSQFIDLSGFTINDRCNSVPNAENIEWSRAFKSIFYTHFLVCGPEESIRRIGRQVISIDNKYFLFSVRVDFFVAVKILLLYLKYS